MHSNLFFARLIIIQSQEANGFSLSLPYLLGKHNIKVPSLGRAVRLLYANDYLSEAA